LNNDDKTSNTVHSIKKKRRDAGDVMREKFLHIKIINCSQKLELLNNKLKVNLVKKRSRLELHKTVFLSYLLCDNEIWSKEQEKISWKNVILNLKGGKESSQPQKQRISTRTPDCVIIKEKEN